ncbi:MAG: hypothetical protein EZS28_046230, partial [Streblomastix strix]
RVSFTLDGKDEQQSILLQKDNNQHLLTLEDSFLQTSELTVELTGSKTSMIRSNGQRMSVVKGMRMGRGQQEEGLISGSAFEVVRGGLTLIDLKMKDVTMIGNDGNKNSEIKDSLKGLIIMKEKASLLKMEKFLIENITSQGINNEDITSAIVMQGGKNSRLELLNGQFNLAIYTSTGGAIYANPQETSLIQVEGVLFQNQGSGQTGSRGGAVFVNMRNYNVEMKFTRCVFYRNNAEKGSNIFIQYQTFQQRVDKSSFTGCTAIVGSSTEQEVSVMYTVGSSATEVFIDERNLLHSSFSKQQQKEVVRFIANPDEDHDFDSTQKCGFQDNPCDTYASMIKYLEKEVHNPDGSSGRVETIIFWKGKYEQQALRLQQTNADSVNIIGCGSAETDLEAWPNQQNVLLQGGVGQ